MISKNFDFTVFQQVGAPQNSGRPSQQSNGLSYTEDMSNFNVFQRFCIMLIALHGDLERITQ